MKLDQHIAVIPIPHMKKDAKGILSEHPSKRFQNTYCPFQIKFKVCKTGLPE